MSYIQIDTKKALVVVVIIVIVIFFLVAKGIAGHNPNYYANCYEAKAHHDTNIPKGSKYYRASLDGDGDGFACE